MLLSHVEAADLAVVNTFFKKKDEHLITYCSGGVATQIDYMLVRRKELKNIIDAKVIPSDGIAPQHRLLVMDVRLQHRRPLRPMVPLQRIKWFKMSEHEAELQAVVKAALSAASSADANTKWARLERAITEGARSLLGTTKPGRPFIEKQTWWW
ncbi:hypothetical protein Y032_0021g334 [Ancylostoma ceylanicum]|uniref:Endonuclease/exonuclease/phosphatase domain-containing protein n=1 Tax=Ancylostoma ceylanicum TaxID=53326 RepID=A0A016V0W1_9BILA|nr:hypothetical protein Y032_0021g334 [Ancylostoma ceylanicum]